jgi:uncharacterized RmlC-like cupin family protein
MLQATRIKFEKLIGTIYDFPLVGDELPKHWHKENQSHISIVARGSFRTFGNTWEKVVSSGDVIDWPAMRPHGFVSLEPNSRLVNIAKNHCETINQDGDVPDGLKEMVL